MTKIQSQSVILIQALKQAPFSRVILIHEQEISPLYPMQLIKLKSKIYLQILI